jgi:Tol biopolymer transport system component
MKVELMDKDGNKVRDMLLEPSRIDTPRVIHDKDNKTMYALDGTGRGYIYTEVNFYEF